MAKTYVTNVDLRHSPYVFRFNNRPEVYQSVVNHHDVISIADEIPLLPEVEHRILIPYESIGRVRQEYTEAESSPVEDAFCKED